MKSRKKFPLILSLIIVALCFFEPAESAAAFKKSAEHTSLQSLRDSAVEVKESELQYKLIPQKDPNRAIITKYTGDDTALVIPEKLGGYPVSSISTNAFSDCDKLEYIMLPSKVTSISAKHFSASASMQYIDIVPANEKLISVDGVVYNRDMTSVFAFPNAKGGSFTIPNGVKTISSQSFYDCPYLTEVIMPNSVEAVYSEAFCRCISLGNVVMSANLTVISDLAFAYCDDLSAIELPYSLTYIGENAFLGYLGSGNDSKIYYLTDGLYYVSGSYAEEYVKTLHLPNEVKHFVDRKITDYDTGITVIDPSNVLPNSGKLELTVEVLPGDNEYLNLLPGVFGETYTYNINLTNDGKAIPLSSNIIINFGGLKSDTIISATRIFRVDGDDLVEYQKNPNAPFAGASVKNFGTYIVAVGTSFTTKGDINGDSVISTHDAVFALHIAAGTATPTDTQRRLADYDNDGKVTTDDALLILRKAADIIQAA